QQEKRRLKAVNSEAGRKNPQVQILEHGHIDGTANAESRSSKGMAKSSKQLRSACSQLLLAEKPKPTAIKITFGRRTSIPTHASKTNRRRLKASTASDCVANEFTITVSRHYLDRLHHIALRTLAQGRQSRARKGKQEESRTRFRSRYLDRLSDHKLPSPPLPRRLLPVVDRHHWSSAREGGGGFREGFEFLGPWLPAKP
ncbi:hypothetical protein GW17_00056160, partial [Ensete ventricosum]